MNFLSIYLINTNGAGLKLIRAAKKFYAAGCGTGFFKSDQWKESRMHAGDKKRYFTTSDIAMLRRVLDKAGLPDEVAHPQYDKRDAAARLLVALFEQGITIENKLTEALKASMTSSSIVTSPTYQITRDSLHFGPTTTVSAVGGYRYGKRIERNGTWTIYHVFSGVPAEYAAWKMVGLDVKTAARALRILNVPAGARVAP
jgi:hypothetical protein